LVLFGLTLGVWALLEVGLHLWERIQGRGLADRDRGTRLLLSGMIAAAIVLARVSVGLTHSLRIPGPYRAAGLVIIWLGLVIRSWAIVALGRSFRTTVEVDPG
jgi:protein-S-isoprenylcysteine O-methyltransferase Ste14